MADFALLNPSKLISRKTIVIEKSWYFHTVSAEFVYNSKFTWNQMVFEDISQNSQGWLKNSFTFLSLKFLKTYHSMEISGFLCYSDFTWNQFWTILKFWNCHFCHFGAVNFHNLENSSLQKVQKFKKIRI